MDSKYYKEEYIKELIENYKNGNKNGFIMFLEKLTSNISRPLWIYIFKNNFNYTKEKQNFVIDFIINNLRKIDFYIYYYNSEKSNSFNYFKEIIKREIVWISKNTIIIYNKWTAKERKRKLNKLIYEEV